MLFVHELTIFPYPSCWLRYLANLTECIKSIYWEVSCSTYQKPKVWIRSVSRGKTKGSTLWGNPSSFKSSSPDSWILLCRLCSFRLCWWYGKGSQVIAKDSWLKGRCWTESRGLNYEECGQIKWTAQRALARVARECKWSSLEGLVTIVTLITRCWRAYGQKKLVGRTGTTGRTGRTGRYTVVRKTRDVAVTSLIQHSKLDL